MRWIIAVTLLALASACNYSHVGPVATTFSRPTPPLGAGSLEIQTAPLALRISRHIDTILHGPDNEEDQVLVLNVHDFPLNKKVPVPSDKVTAEFTATRFGPGSQGDAFSGYLIVRKVTPRKVDVYLHLDVSASTASGSYTETAQYRGDFTFLQRHEEPPSP